MFVKIKSKDVEIFESVDESPWQYSRAEVLFECDEVFWNWILARSEDDLRKAVGDMLCQATGSYEVLEDSMPKDWSDRGERFILLRLVSDGGADIRPIMIHDQRVYLMNSSGKTIERIR